MLHNVMGSRHVGEPQRAALVELHEAMDNRPFNRSLILWLLGTDADEQRIVDAELHDFPGPYPDPVLYRLLGHRALADRNPRAAAAHYVEVLERSPQDVETRRLRLYALCLGGEFEAARKVARELPQHLLDPSEERMLAEQFGLMIPLHRRKD